MAGQTSRLRRAGWYARCITSRLGPVPRRDAGSAVAEDDDPDVRPDQRVPIQHARGRRVTTVVDRLAAWTGWKRQPRGPEKSTACRADGKRAVQGLDAAFQRIGVRKPEHRKQRIAAGLVLPSSLAER